MEYSGPPPTPCYQLQKEEMWPHQPTPTKEEAKVNDSLYWRLAGMQMWTGEELDDLVAWQAVFFSIA